jgi:hypothetical protein
VRLARRLSAPVALVAATVVATPAAATFGPPLDLSAPGRHAFDPQVAMDPAGNALFTWSRDDGADSRIQARVRSAAGLLGGSQTLSAAGQDATLPRVAVDDQGDAVFTWLRSDGTHRRVEARARTAGGALGAVQILSGAGQAAQEPQVAVDADGDAVFAWYRQVGAHQRIQVRARSAAGVLSPVQTVSPLGDADGARVALDADGDAIISWLFFDGENFRLQARARTAAGALSAIQTLSRPGSASSADLAIDGDGDAVFVWQWFDSPNLRVETRTRSAAGALSAIQPLSAAGADATQADVAVAPSGEVVYTWRLHDGTRQRVQARPRSGAGALGATQTLSGRTVDVIDPEVAVDDGGAAVFTWARFDATTQVIEARERTAAGTLFALQVLSDDARPSGDPHVAVDADGDAATVWERHDGSNFRIQAAFGP